MPAPRRPAYPRSDHFDGTRFFNPGVNTDKGFRDLLRWRREGHRMAWPAHIPSPPAQPRRAEVAAGEIDLTYIGQATYLIRTSTLAILTDPIFSRRASPFGFAGPERVRDPGVALADLPPIDVVLLSHNHYDHMDVASLRTLTARWKPVIVTGLGNGAYLAGKGVPGAVELDWWQDAPAAVGCPVTYVPAQHWSSRTMLDRRRMLWGGFVVDLGGTQLYFAGDTGFFPGFAAIRARCGSPDVALLPIGAYEPRWFMQTQHMNPADAVEAHRVLGAQLSLALHWGTFQLTDEAIDAPLEALIAAKAAAGVQPDAFLAPLPGETVTWRRQAAEPL